MLPIPLDALSGAVVSAREKNDPLIQFAARLPSGEQRAVC